MISSTLTYKDFQLYPIQRAVHMNMLAGALSRFVKEVDRKMKLNDETGEY